MPHIYEEKHNTCLQYLGFLHRTELEMINGTIEIANELRPHRSISYLSRVLTVAGHFSRATGDTEGRAGPRQKGISCTIGSNPQLNPNEAP